MNRQQRRKAQRRQHHHNAQHHGVMVAWAASEADLPEARQQTHDRLIATMGDQRRGGVTWRQTTGDQAVETMAMLTEGATCELADYYRRIRAMLREHGGWVVVASAPGEPR